MKNRMRIVLCIFLAVVLVVTAKLGYEQLFHASQLERGALEARLREMDIKPERGTIYDRKGSALAISVATESVYINPTVIRKEDQKEKKRQQSCRPDHADRLGVVLNGHHQLYGQLFSQQHQRPAQYQSRNRLHGFSGYDPQQ